MVVTQKLIKNWINPSLTTDNHWLNKAELWLLLAIAFLIPLHQPLSSFFSFVVLALWLINQVRSYQRCGNLFPLFKKNVFALSAIYFLFIAGSFYSSDKDATLFDLQVKLPIVAFAAFFATRTIRRETTKIIGIAFIAGTLLSSFVMLIAATIKYTAELDAGVFYYVLLASPYHPTYFAMYLIWSMVLITELTVSHEVKPYSAKAIAYWMLYLFFHIMVVLMSSKAGLLSLVLAWCFVIFKVSTLYKSWKKTMICLLIAASAYILSAALFPRSFGRIETAGEAISQVDKSNGSNTESTFQRVMIWKASVEIVKNHWITGVGTGDVRKALESEYRTSGNVAGLEAGLNVHNQYLQVGIALGIPGVVVFLITIGWPFVLALYRKYWAYAFFLLAVGMNLLFESMLERQAGVMFYAFFTTLYFTQLPDYKNPKKTNHPVRRNQ